MEANGTYIVKYIAHIISIGINNRRFVSQDSQTKPLGNTHPHPPPHHPSSI